MLGQRDNQKPYIYVKSLVTADEPIRMSFDTESVFNKWLEVVQMNKKTDEEMNTYIKMKESKDFFQLQQARGKEEIPKFPVKLKSKAQLAFVNVDSDKDSLIKQVEENLQSNRKWHL